MGKRVVHVEFPAQDINRAEKFWEAVGGWSIEAGMPGIDYRMFQEGDQGGAVHVGDGTTHGALVYYGGEDIDADIAKVREAGGEAVDKQPIPGIGWFTRCKDTEGNPFGLFQSDESVPMPEGAPGA
jgi:predicted enzyme related to lactoylglutathione lyase